ncbi:hypothetical protein FRC07_014335 [Ceratobasidium sp. 392]|nr:hypothetical protein FRC07_014335 [Ceratobasidium sp. 392]
MASNSTKHPVNTEDDIDAETIQSTVDMSLSLALNMVQSWMPAATVAVDPAITESRKKLEEYMRRPPRLGVGAPLPQANQTQNQATHHETQRLKNRLVGSGAARKRAEDTKLNGSNKPESESEGEEESRTTAVKNKKQANGTTSVFGPTATPKSRTRPIATISSPSPSVPRPPTTPSSTTSPVREATPNKPSSPTQPTTSPNEPMGIHTLHPKLSLAAKIWPRSNGAPSPSPTSAGPDRKRRKMLPPLSWNIQMQVPASPRSSSVSAPPSVSSSQAPTDTTAEEESDRSDSTVQLAQLSRKERKRLRREAEAGAQQSVSGPGEKEPLVLSGSERESASEAETLQLSPSAKEDLDVSAPRAETDESGEGEGLEMVSRIRENGERDNSVKYMNRGLIYSETRQGVSGKASDKNDTVQQEGKRKRKRRAKKKPVPG